MSEYIVTLKNYSDLDDLYTQMEESSGSDTIPHRKCTCTSRRKISRNTHYDLTEQEALELAKDSRVLAVEEPKADFVPFWDQEQTADFQKTVGVNDGGLDISSTDKNCGLFRTINGAGVATWGSDNTTSHNATINTTSSGKNVDVVIVDAHIVGSHPEFAVHPDATGGTTRFVPFNWFQYSSALGYNTNATYRYDLGTSYHGTHVAGIAAGNTQGWARDADIYNMEFMGYAGGTQTGDEQGVNGQWTYMLWDYLRHFHKNKDINPATGRRNPTITNHSWGSLYNTYNSVNSVNSVKYRGTTTSVTGSISERKAILEANGVPVRQSQYVAFWPSRNAAIDADVIDAIADGVVVISSAGNSYWAVDVPSGEDYDNTFTRYGSQTYFTTRGSSPSAATGVICVGSVGTKTAEYKSEFSNFDERIDIWAPGSKIISSIGSSNDPNALNIPSNSEWENAASDPRNSNYKIASVSGTSMSGPQVTGYIACLAEQEQNITNDTALQHLTENAKANIGDRGDVPPYGEPFESLSDSNNRYMFYVKKRPDSGVAYPSETQNNRNPTTNGVKYPRTSSLVTKTS